VSSLFLKQGVYSKFTTESAGERILKISQHLAKLQIKV